MSSHKVVVVGAGPAGAMAAIRLAEQGVRDVLVVDRDKFPRVKPCASGLGPNALKILDQVGLGAEIRREAYPVNCLRLITPGRREMLLPSEGAAVVYERQKLDSLLVKAAVERGVTFRDQVAVSGLLREGGRVVGVQAGGEELRAQVVLVANGANCTFTADSRPRRIIATMMSWWDGFPIEPGKMEMFWDKRISPLYGWLFPENDHRVNIGVCVDSVDARGRKRFQNLRALYQELLDDYFGDRLKKARQVGEWKSHPISHTVWVKDVAKPGVLYLGEAARLVHNATGEGIFQAMQSGLYAASAVRDVLVDGVAEERAWRQYTRTLRFRFTVPFALGYVVRGALGSPLLDVVARLHNSPTVRRVAGTVISSALSGAKVSGRAEAR
ncbi:MAG TPA: NAD(P)/FAD-dependent oxidoreductase [Myxococcales bacterium]|jgi:geranylgeranyl reductase family protein